MKRFIFLILAAGCFIGIFLFSCQIAETSDGLSRGIAAKILAFFTDYEKLDVTGQQAMLANFNEVVRSLAHFSIFLASGLFLYLWIQGTSVRHPALIAFIFCVIYAIGDEIHQQFFTEGRAFQLVDLCKDWSGSLLGILIAMGIIKIFTKKNCYSN